MVYYVFEERKEPLASDDLKIDLSEAKRVLKDQGFPDEEAEILAYMLFLTIREHLLRSRAIRVARYYTSLQQVVVGLRELLNRYKDLRALAEVWNGGIKGLLLGNAARSGSQFNDRWRKLNEQVQDFFNGLFFRIDLVSKLIDDWLNNLTGLAPDPLSFELGVPIYGLDELINGTQGKGAETSKSGGDLCKGPSQTGS